MTAAHHTCPHCHRPIALDRFEYATDGEHFFLVCPECDHSLTMVDGEGWPVRAQHTGVEASMPQPPVPARRPVDA